MAPTGSQMRDVYDSVNAGDPTPVLELLAQDAEWVEPDGAPLVGGRHRGPDGVLQGVFAAVGDGYERFRVDVDEVIEAGDVIVVLGHVRAAVRETGRAAEAPFAHVWRFESDRVVAWRCYEDTHLLQAAWA